MQRFLEGYQRFHGGITHEQRQLFAALARGQKPETLVVTCVDSRVDPAMVFNTKPGEMLVIRNVANLVPPYEPDDKPHSTSAALEFGVNVLEVSDIIVLGHGQCGGVHALLLGAPGNAQDFIAPWMAIARTARDVALQCQVPERQQRCEHEVIKVALTNLMTYPWIKERVETGRIKLHGAWLDIGTLELMVLQPNDRFVLVAQAIPERTPKTDAGLNAKPQVTVIPPP